MNSADFSVLSEVGVAPAESQSVGSRPRCQVVADFVKLAHSVFAEPIGLDQQIRVGCLHERHPYRYHADRSPLPGTGVCRTHPCGHTGPQANRNLL